MVTLYRHELFLEFNEVERGLLLGFLGDRVREVGDCQEWLGCGGGFRGMLSGLDLGVVDYERLVGVLWRGDLHLFDVLVLWYFLQGFDIDLGVRYGVGCDLDVCLVLAHANFEVLGDFKAKDLGFDLDVSNLDCIYDLDQAVVRGGLDAMFARARALAAMSVVRPLVDERVYKRRRGRPSRCPSGLLLCEDCKQCLPVSNFARNRASPTGYQKKCRRCRRLYDQRRRAKASVPIKQ